MLNPNLDILVVEDDPVTRRMVCGLLQRLGIQTVREAEDGKSALEEIDKQKPQMVITDWGMPKLNGLQLLQIIRKREALKHMPVLMITGRAEKEYVLTAAQEGVSSYIVKPFDAATLEAKILKMLN
jgi:two-component system chemotaxis response regulator CheY